MPRPRSFDTDHALDAAMQAFWKQGYEATSLEDLMAAMDLRKGSIYQAFGDKHQLFVAALRRYLAGGHASLEQRMREAGTELDAVRVFIEAAWQTCQTHAPSQGCFAVNTLVELGPHDDEIAGILNGHFEVVRGLLSSYIARGQRNGTIRADREPAELVAFLTTIQVGLVTSAKTNRHRDELLQVVDFALAQLAAP